MRRVTCLVVALLLPLVAAAQGRDSVSYSYFHVGYADAEIYSLDGSGYDLEASVSAGEHFYLFASFGSAELDDTSGAELSEKVIGFGVHFDVSDNVSLYTALGYTEIELDTIIGSAVDDGRYLRGGVRFKPTDQLELRAGVERADFDELLGEDTAIVLGVDVFATDAVSFALNYREYDDLSFLTLAARFHFGGTSRSPRRPPSRR